MDNPQPSPTESSTLHGFCSQAKWRWRQCSSIKICLFFSLSLSLRYGRSRFEKTSRHIVIAVMPLTKCIWTSKNNWFRGLSRADTTRLQIFWYQLILYLILTHLGATKSREPKASLPPSHGKVGGDIVKLRERPKARHVLSVDGNRHVARLTTLGRVTTIGMEQWVIRSQVLTRVKDTSWCNDSLWMQFTD